MEHSQSARIKAEKRSDSGALSGFPKAYRVLLSPLTYIHVGEAYRVLLSPLAYVHVGEA